MSNTIVITGANRGIGLELTRQYLESDDSAQVIACARNPEQAEELRSLVSQYPERLTLRTLDVCNSKQIDALRSELNSGSIDILINNAGIYGPRASSYPMPVEDWLAVFATNSIAPVNLSMALLPALKRDGGAVVANITSKMGSMGDNTSGGSMIYRSSKAAINAAMRSFALDHADEGIHTLLLHPGWVQTDMGGPSAWIDAQTSASGLRTRIAEASQQEPGAFLAYDGKAIPW